MLDFKHITFVCFQVFRVLMAKLDSINIREELNSANNVGEGFLRCAQISPTGIIYQQVENWATSTTDSSDPRLNIIEKSREEVVNRIYRIATHLSRYIKRGDKVAIISNSRPEWLEADLATLILGGVVVSVYQSLTPNEIAYILFDSASSVVFVENGEQAAKVKRVIQESFSIPAVEERPAQVAKIILKQIISFEDVDDNDVINFSGIIETKELATNSLEKLKGLLEQTSRKDLATIVYTSGTTGAPKGVMQTHGNHLANIRQAFDAGMYRGDSRIFIMLPLAHSFAKLMAYIGFLTPALLQFPRITDRKSSKSDPNQIMRDMRLVEPTLVPVVPRLLEKIQSGIVTRSNGSSIAAKILKTTIKTAQRVFNANQQGKSSNLFDRIVFAATAGIRRKMKIAIFGERFGYAVSGGAKLSTETAKFFAALEVPVVEGYGLTETCVATNVNRLERNKIGTVGPVLSEDIEVKLKEDGEICFRGPNISIGYINRPQATSEAWDSDGWFMTGDLGSLDSEGSLSIVGRKKEIIVTSGGKKIVPELIEQRVKSKGLLSQVVLIGEGHNYCVALFTLDQEQIRAWLSNEGINSNLPIHEIPQVLEEIGKRLDEVNKELASFETIKRFKVLEGDFTIDNGLLTPTLKVKRKRVEERYAAEIEKLYA